MSDENIKNNLPEDEDVSKETEAAPSEDWKWDATVSETQTGNITLDDLMVEKEEIATAEAADEETQEEAVEENSDDGLCIVCGNPRKDSPSDLYCNECREKFLRTDYGVGHIVLAFVMVIVAAIGYFTCTSTISIASKLSKAESYVSEKRYDDAVNECSKITEDVDKINAGVNAIFTSVNKGFTAVDWFNEGEKTTVLLLDSYADIITTNGNDNENFINAVESSFIGKDGSFDYSRLESKDCQKIKKVYDFCKELSKASQPYIEGIQKYISYAEDSSIVMDYDKAMKYIEGLNPKTQGEKCMADYCRFLAAFYSEKDIKTITEIFESLFKNAGEFEYIFWQTYMDVCYQKEAYDQLTTVTEKATLRNLNDTTAYRYQIQSYMYKGDFASADTTCEALKKNNPDGLDYYSMKAAVLRRQGKFDDAVKICKDGVAKGQDSEIYRQQAIAYMLLDNQSSALEAIKQAYDIELKNAYAGGGSYNIVDVLNTTALIAQICNDKDTYNEIVELFKNQNMDFNKSVQNCIKGEITFEQIFMEGKGEV